MSIRVMSTVWEKSRTKGNDRLCLLSLADKANDDGYCWPGITVIQSQMNCERETTLSSLDRLEASGELYAVRKQRVGSKFLILTGLVDKQIVDRLVTYFKMPEDEANRTLGIITENRNKSRIPTSKKTSNLARINDSKKSTDPTKIVYESDQNSLAARLESSLNITNHQLHDAKKQASAEAGEPEQKMLPLEQEPEQDEKPKRARSANQLTLDLMVNAIVDVFKLDPDTIPGKRWTGLRGAAKQLIEGKAVPGDMPALLDYLIHDRRFTNPTEYAMAKHWPEFVRDRRSASMQSPSVPASQKAEQALYAGGEK